MRFFVAALASCAVVLPLAAFAADGLALRPDGRDAPRWQGRLAIGAHSHVHPAGAGSRAGSAEERGVGGFSLMGDYYFLHRTLPGTAGGFRATSGVVGGVRPTLWAGMPGAVSLQGVSVDRQSLAGDVEAPTAPYLGVGYTGLSLRQRWNVSADVGWYASSPGTAVRFGRMVSGTQNFDDFVRELRLSPVVQLGVSYAF